MDGQWPPLMVCLVGYGHLEFCFAVSGCHAFNVAAVTFAAHSRDQTMSVLKEQMCIMVVTVDAVDAVALALGMRPPPFAM